MSRTIQHTPVLVSRSDEKSPLRVVHIESANSVVLSKPRRRLRIIWVGIPDHPNLREVDYMPCRCGEGASVMSSGIHARRKHLNSRGEVLQAIRDASLHAYTSHCMASATWYAGCCRRAQSRYPGPGSGCSRAHVAYKQQALLDNQTQARACPQS